MFVLQGFPWHNCAESFTFQLDTSGLVVDLGRGCIYDKGIMSQILRENLFEVDGSSQVVDIGVHRDDNKKKEGAFHCIKLGVSCNITTYTGLLFI